MPTDGSLIELRRYPVKSLGGETLAAAEVDRRGIDGDRLWAVIDPDGRLGSSKSTRRFRKMAGLLQLTATYDEHLEPVIGFPDGRRVAAADPGVHAALSEHVGQPVELRREGASSHFDEGPLHLVTTASLAALTDAHGAEVSAARLRASLLVDVGSPEGFVEGGWVGRTLGIGTDLVLRVRGVMPRCVMVDQPQEGLPAAPGLLATIGRVNQACAGIVADVVRPGTAQLDDPVRLVP